MNRFQFRRDPDLVAQWKNDLEKDKLLQLVLDVMENDHPARDALQGDNNNDVSPTRAGIELGLTRGYSMALGRLKQLATPLTSKELEGLPPSEYLPEETEEKPKKKR